MGTLLGIVLGLILAVGLILIITPAADPDPEAPRVPLTRRLGLSSDRGRTYAIATGAGVLGLLTGAVTGWWVATIVFPAIVIGGPALVRPPDTKKATDRLTDLETWLRGMSAVMVGGAMSLENALRVSLTSAPATIRPSLARLVARLNAQQPTKSALEAWADEMADPSTDMVAACLILESIRRSGGLPRALNELAESTAELARARRQIDTERSGTLTAVRWITIITISVIALMVVTGTNTEPYLSPVGQGVALLLLGMFIGSLLWMRSIARGRPPARFLPATTAGGRR